MSAALAFAKRMLLHRRRVLRFLSRAWDSFPLTVFGILMVCAGVFTLKVLAAESMDMVLRLLGLGAISLVSLAVILVGCTALALKYRGAPEWPGDLTFETGAPVATGVRLPWLGFLPLVHVRFEWLSPRRVEVAPRRRWVQLNEVVIAQERGLHDELRRRVVIQDVLGLSQLAIRWRQPASMTILPRIGQLGRLRVLRSLAGGEEWPHPMGLDDGDRVELRRYVAGDPARFIHWKIFARTRQLVVRMPERALSRADRTAAFLITGPKDDASAAVARLALEEGSLGVEWTFGADGAERPTDNRKEALAAVVRSKGANGSPAAGLLEFVRKSEQRGPMSLVLFAPPTPGPWMDQVLALVRRRPQGFRVIIGVDTVRNGGAPGTVGHRLRRFLFRAEQDSEDSVQVTEKSLRELHSRLARPFVDVLIVSRSNGQILSRQGGGPSEGVSTRLTPSRWATAADSQPTAGPHA